MCIFEYYHYDGCGHKCIELLTHCAQHLWKAGMTGELWACPETRYARNAMMLSPLTWDGVHGYCRYCKQKFVMPQTPFCRSLNDVHIPAFRPSTSTTPPNSTLNDSTISPSRSSIYSSPSVYLSPSTSVSTLLSSSTQNLSKGIFESPHVPSPDFIYTQQFSATVPFLLGTSYQYSISSVHEGDPILFPSKLSKYDPSEEQKLRQWLVHGYIDGKQLSECVSNFSNRGGMTAADIDRVKCALLTGTIYRLWKQELEERGMPWPTFLESARAIGKYMGLGSIAGIVMAEIRESDPEKMPGLSRPLL